MKTIEVKQPTPALLDEYGLNQITYRLLSLARGGPLSWGSPDHHARLKEISGNPAASIRKMIDRKLLTGPARGEKIQSRLIGLTATGLDTLERIERGLHRPVWLSEHKAAALKHLAEGGRDSRKGLNRAGAAGATITSLLKAGYIEVEMDEKPYLKRPIERFSLTDLGREAWAEYSSQ